MNIVFFIQGNLKVVIINLKEVYSFVTQFCQILEIKYFVITAFCLKILIMVIKRCMKSWDEQISYHNIIPSFFKKIKQRTTDEA